MKGLDKQICLFTSEIEGLNLVHDLFSSLSSNSDMYIVTFLPYCYLPKYCELEIETENNLKVTALVSGRTKFYKTAPHEKINRCLTDIFKI